MPNLPRSIDVWVCPACERAHSHQAGQTASICGCTGWDAAGVQRVRATYVLSAVSEEMVERTAKTMYEHSDGSDFAWDQLTDGQRARWRDDATNVLAAALSTEAPDA